MQVAFFFFFKFLFSEIDGEKGRKIETCEKPDIDTVISSWGIGKARD